MTSRWILLGVPWDCSASDRGEADAPAWLRRAGIRALADVDLGDIPIEIRTARRDPETGVLALADTIRAAHRLADALAAAMAEHPGHRPLVVGGDCSILLGIFPALRQSRGPTGLWFVDGHPDYQDSHASETGETADLELACLTGAGPAPLVHLVPDPPMVRPQDAVLMGHRGRDLDEAARAEVQRVPPELLQIDADEVRTDPLAAGQRAADRLERTGRDAWLHIDLDVLDPGALPAVTYPQPDGPGWEELTAALTPLAASPRLIGLSVADFRPDLDPDGSSAARVVQRLGELLGGA